MTLNPAKDWKSWFKGLLVAIIIGIGLGTLLGLVEGFTTLVSKGLLGRYPELVLWAILSDTTVLVAFELLAAFIIGAGLLLLRRRPTVYFVPILLGLGVFVATVFLAAWVQFNSDPTQSIPAILQAILPAFALGVILGLIVALAGTFVIRKAPRIQQVRGRYVIGTLAVIWLLALVYALNLHSDAPVTQAAASDPQTGSRLNVVIVTIDTLRGDSIGLDGSPVVKTPNLDKLGHSGTWFTNEIIQQPNTNASHTSIFTGVFPFVHGVRQHMVDRLSPDVQTLAEILDQQGYQTAGLYSWVSLEPGFSGLRGFQTYEDLSVRLTPLLRDPHFQDLIVLYRLLGTYLFVPGLIENQVLQTSQDAVEDTADGKADITTDGALRWLDANANGSKPFFLWVHYYDPHYPYVPPPPFDKMYDAGYTGNVDGGMDTIHYILKNGTGDLTPADVDHLHALYDGEISFTDQQVGRLIDRIDQMGLTNNTIVVVTADHGEGLGILSRWFHGPRVNYTDIHVPLMMRLPGVIPTNQPIYDAVESVDIMPTILDMLKLPIPQDVQGQSLLPLMQGKKEDLHPALSMLDTYKQMSLVNSDWHLIWDRDKSQFELFDYHKDPNEVVDVAGQHPDIVSQMQQTITGELQRLGFTGE